MYYKNNEFWSEGEKSDKKESNFLKETSPSEYYSKRATDKKRRCICTNQNLVAKDNFCENCNSYIWFKY